MSKLVEVRYPHGRHFVGEGGRLSVTIPDPPPRRVLIQKDPPLVVPPLLDPAPLLDAPAPAVSA